jgi:transcriptional regulator with XRE-family HTH domain
MPDRAVDPRFPDRMRQLLDQRGVSYRVLAARTFHAKSYLHDLATGRKAPTAEVAKRIDEALAAGGDLAALVRVGAAVRIGDEIDAVELGRRVAASDLSAETLQRLEDAVDELATRYAGTPPDLLLPQVRQHLAYVARLIDVRKTLAQHRRLLVAGGWLSLLAATVHIDLHQRTAGRANLGTARQLAEHAEHPEILGWVLETRAWDALTVGGYRRAVELSQQAQAVAPRGSSAFIQATAQEGRAWARMGDPARTRDALNRTARLVGPLKPPDRPEHHYRYDPGKALAYTATTLAWVGDPAAEDYARAVVAQLEAAPDGTSRPRRVASARLDLALALLVANKPDEAGAVALAAITSGRVVPSNWWRVTEVMAGVDQADAPEADDLRDAYETYRPAAGK